MVKYREILRLHAMGVSIRNIAFSCRCSTATVRAVTGRAKAAGIEWPLPEEMGDRAIREVIYPPKSKADPDKAPIDHDHVDAEMSRPGVTMMLLWSEYCESAVSQGRSPYMYSAFCERHRKWAMSRKTAMRIAHKPAEQMQVDYVGDTMEVVDMDTGEVLKVYVFAACLPFSGKLYAKGSYDMREESWVDAHVSAFSFFGGTLLENPWQPGGFKSINILWLIPLISALTAVASSIISMRYTKQLTPQGEKVPGQGCSNVMMLGLMPMFSLYIAFIVPGGVGIYWICSNIIAVVQTIILNNIYNPAKIRAQAEAEYEERRKRKAEDKKRLKEARLREEEEARRQAKEEAEEKERARLEAAAAAKKPVEPSKNPNKIKKREAAASKTEETTKKEDDAPEEKPDDGHLPKDFEDLKEKSDPDRE